MAEAIPTLHLVIEIVKRTDGGAVLRCTRADGSVSWQSQQGKQATFFPLHDLTHYAVESVLGTSLAFFGLIAAGWEIDDTTGTGAHGALPDEAMFVEWVVGMLDVERGTGSRWDADAFQREIVAAEPRLAALAERLLTTGLMDEIRLRRANLFDRWFALAPGDALTLHFPASTSPRAHATGERR